MEIRVEKSNSKFVFLKMTGKFNIEAVSLFETTFKEQINISIPTIIINLSDLTYIDSSGIGALVKSMNVSKSSNIELIFSDPNTNVLNILKLAYLDKFFTLLSPEELKARFPEL